MIDNYLDWVKRQRKFHMRMAARYNREVTRTPSEWGQGFSKGVAMTHDYSNRMLRRLQKSLEEHIEYACSHSSPEVWERFSKSLLS